jgi:hypothetical protein
MVGASSRFHHVRQTAACGSPFSFAQPGSFDRLMNTRKILLNGALSISLVHSGLAIAQGRTETTAAKCSGIWSAGSTVLVDSDSRPKAIPSPNGNTHIAVIDGALWFEMDSGKRWPLDVYLNPPNTEIIWSGDSSRFVVNTSDGGIVGGWDVDVFSAQSNGPKKMNLHVAVHSLAERLPHCEGKETPNFAALAWLRGGKEILLVAEAPPHSSCTNMGALAAYRLSADSGRVLEQLPQDRLLKEYGSLLGCRIRESR